MGIKIKVCGMKYPENIQAVAAHAPDYLGFIFYEKSKRFVNDLDPRIVQLVNPSIARVGVFVNHPISFIEQQSKKYGFETLQLHGDETPEYCQQLKEKGYTLVKAFQVGDGFNFAAINPYKSSVDYFLFDTKSEGYGGTGKKFDWKIFKKYDNEVPIFLSGGLDIEHIDEIKKLNYLNIHALDINSKFEIEPGRKNEGKIKLFIDRIRDEIRS
ncbi:MAG TPA: phosphoribosylanthranilate isomerase [Cytophagaceae bacterium]|jgi:phosphoribosylanthranilate isomerase|nr:phosphoribosylanthranilate isomerase [Cytophagaceae bacterium]